MTDQEAVDRAAEAIREYQDHHASEGRSGPWRGTPALEILQEHTGGFTSRTISLARKAIRRAGARRVHRNRKP